MTVAVVSNQNGRRLSGGDHATTNNHHEGLRHNSNHTAPAEDSLRRKCAEETKALRFMKAIFALLLISGTALAGWLIYKYSSGAEEHNFRSKYNDYSEMVLGVFLDNVDRKLKTAQEVSRTITSFAKAMNMTWPMVTIPDFQLQGAIARKQSDALLVVLLPIVRKPRRDEWEAYSVQHQGWLNEKPVGVVNLAAPTTRRHLEGNNDIFKRMEQAREEAADSSGAGTSSLPAFGSIPGRIFKLDSNFFPTPDDRPNGPFVPVWQTSPLPSTPMVVNYDVVTHPILGPHIQTIFLAQQPIISLPVVLDANTHDPIIKELIRMVGLETGKQYERGPLSGMYVPVYDNFQPNRQMVAVLGMEIFWQDYFTNLLPPNANGTLCVLESGCGHTFTFQIMGPDVNFLGEGDLHDMAYDGFEKIAQVTTTLRNDTRSKQHKHQCLYSIRVYPSTMMRNSYKTNRPAVLTFATVVVITFSSLVFVLYDYVTERRQSKIMTTAAGATAIVFALFPATVRDRIFGSQSDNNRTATTSSAKSPTKATTTNVNETEDRTHEELSQTMLAKPIADFFPNATVLFADIVGFSKWSSDRDPEQVFVVLERVFHAFDKCAKQRGVFKVETIQDCYMAVTGLPVPQADHAIIMARFAVDCMEEFSSLLPSLKSILGHDCGNLSLRIGINSGPVTAGVLRGEKSRFQLFGDTVNTAARMQSTGFEGKIQISQDTMESLCLGGKSGWCLIREDKVKAKGKGELQTYWLDLQQT